MMCMHDMNIFFVYPNSGEAIHLFSSSFINLHYIFSGVHNNATGSVNIMCVCVCVRAVANKIYIFNKRDV